MSIRTAALGLLALLAAPPPAGAAEPVVERALRALDADSSLKVRAQAALVLGQHGGREALPTLLHALRADESPAVRIAAASAVARLGDLSGREPLEAAARADPDPGVRTAAERALADLASSAVRALALDDPQGRGDAAARSALKESLTRHLRRQGFTVVGPDKAAGYRLKPSVLELETEQAGGRLLIVVKASVVAVDSRGRMVAMVEGSARLRTASGPAAGSHEQLAARALDAAAVTLSEDLAARLR